MAARHSHPLVLHFCVLAYPKWGFSLLAMFLGRSMTGWPRWRLPQMGTFGFFSWTRTWRVFGSRILTMRSVLSFNRSPFTCYRDKSYSWFDSSDKDSTSSSFYFGDSDLAIENFFGFYFPVPSNYIGFFPILAVKPIIFATACFFTPAGILTCLTNSAEVLSSYSASKWIVAGEAILGLVSREELFLLSDLERIIRGSDMLGEMGYDILTFLL